MKIHQWYEGYNGYRLYFFAELKPGRFIGFEFNVVHLGEINVDIWDDSHEMIEANVKMDPVFMKDAEKKALKEVFENEYYEREV